MKSDAASQDVAGVADPGRTGLDVAGVGDPGAVYPDPSGLPLGRQPDRGRRPRLQNLFPLLLGLLLACATPVRAVEFRVLGWAADDYSLRFDQGGAAVEVRVEAERLSPVYEAPGAPTLTLYRQIEDGDGEPGRQIACAIAVPPGLTQGILVLVPAASDSSSWLGLRVGDRTVRVPRTYEARWLDNSPEARPPGTIEFRNMQSQPIALRVGGRDISLPPQGKAHAPITPEAKRVELKAAARFGEEWRLFASSPLPTRGAGRVMVIFREDTAAPRSTPGIRMVRLYEPPPPPAPSPKAP